EGRGFEVRRDGADVGLAHAMRVEHEALGQLEAGALDTSEGSATPPGLERGSLRLRDLRRPAPAHLRLPAEQLRDAQTTELEQRRIDRPGFPEEPLEGLEVGAQLGPEREGALEVRAARSGLGKPRHRPTVAPSLTTTGASVTKLASSLAT